MRKQTKTIQYIELLTALNSSKGFTFTEAQYAIWTFNHPYATFYDWDYKSYGHPVNRNRGYMSLTLSGNENSGCNEGQGILKYFFEKDAYGKYHRNAVDHENRPLDVMRRISSNRKMGMQFPKPNFTKPEFAPGVVCAGERSSSMPVGTAISYGEQHWYEVAETRRVEIEKLKETILRSAAADGKCRDEIHALKIQIGKDTLTIEKAVNFLMKHRNEAAHAVLDELLKGNISF